MVAPASTDSGPVTENTCRSGRGSTDTEICWSSTERLLVSATESPAPS